MKSNSELKFSQLYNRERRKIDARLKSAFAKRKPRSLYQPADYILKGGGKRLRPLLVLFSCGAAGGRLNEAYNAAAAVELLHNFTLVHDDIMDNSDLRRGRLTLHVKYDLSTAILTGDVLLAAAYEFLLKDCRDKTFDGVAEFTRGLVRVCDGQSVDKEFESRESVSMKEYFSMIEMKTAALMEMCCYLGAELAGASKREANALAGYGRNIGMAFQIHDDLLDIIGNEAKLGKKVGGDLIEGKKTYLFLRALQKAKGNNKFDLIKIIKNKGIKASQIDDYISLYTKLGVVDDASEEIKKYTGYAVEQLKSLKNTEYRSALKWLANSLIKRIK